MNAFVFDTTITWIYSYLDLTYSHILSIVSRQHDGSFVYQLNQMTLMEDDRAFIWKAEHLN